MSYVVSHYTQRPGTNSRVRTEQRVTRLDKAIGIARDLTTDFGDRKRGRITDDATVSATSKHGRTLIGTARAGVFTPTDASRAGIAIQLNTSNKETTMSEYTAHVVNLEGKRKSKKYKQLRAVEAYAVEQSQKPQVSEVRIDSGGKHVATCRTGKWTLPVSIEHPKPRAAASLHEILGETPAPAAAPKPTAAKPKPAAAATVSTPKPKPAPKATKPSAGLTSSAEERELAPMASWTAAPPTTSGDVCIKGRSNKVITRVYLGRTGDDARMQQVVDLFVGLSDLIEVAHGVVIGSVQTGALRASLAKLPPLDFLRTL